MTRPLPLLAIFALLACAGGDEAADSMPADDPAASASADEAEPAEGEWPAGWEARLDHPDRESREEVAFTTMSPGWHVTTGPATILWDPADTASGSYRVEAEIFLFDPGQRREGFGLFIGGRDLQGEGQRYTYFLIRRDGRFLIKKRQGEETMTVQDWTEAPAIVTWEERGEETADNVLALDVGPEEVVFSVNGEEVARQPRSAVDADGVVGLRVNHGLNLHVSRLDVTNGGGNR